MGFFVNTLPVAEWLVRTCPAKGRATVIGGPKLLGHEQYARGWCHLLFALNDKPLKIVQSRVTTLPGLHLQGGGCTPIIRLDASETKVSTANVALTKGVSPMRRQTRARAQRDGRPDQRRDSDRIATEGTIISCAQRQRPQNAILPQSEHLLAEFLH